MSEEYVLRYAWEAQYNVFKESRDTGPEIRDFLDIGEEQIPTVEQLENTGETHFNEYAGNEFITGISNSLQITFKNVGEETYPGGVVTNMEFVIPLPGTYTHNFDVEDEVLPELHHGDSASINVDIGRPGSSGTGNFSFDVVSNDGEPVIPLPVDDDDSQSEFSVTIADRDQLRILSEVHKIRNALIGGETAGDSE